MKDKRAWHANGSACAASQCEDIDLATTCAFCGASAIGENCAAANCERTLSNSRSRPRRRTRYRPGAVARTRRAQLFRRAALRCDGRERGRALDWVARGQAEDIAISPFHIPVEPAQLPVQRGARAARRGRHLAASAGWRGRTGWAAYGDRSGVGADSRAPATPARWNNAWRMPTTRSPRRWSLSDCARSDARWQRFRKTCPGVWATACLPSTSRWIEAPTRQRSCARSASSAMRQSPRCGQVIVS